MDMKQWVSDQIQAKEKKALPVLTFPAAEKLGITTKELIYSPDLQAQAMKYIYDHTDMAAVFYPLKPKRSGRRFATVMMKSLPLSAPLWTRIATLTSSSFPILAKDVRACASKGCASSRSRSMTSQS